MADSSDRNRDKFTSLKLDIINGACIDPDLSPAAFRFLVRVMEAADEDTWDRATCTFEARISDDVFADEVRGMRDRHTLADYRKAIRKAGWFTYEPGGIEKDGARRATRYVITDKPVNPLFDHREELRQLRKERRAARLASEREAANAGGKRRQKPPSRRGETPPSAGDLSPHLHLSSSPSGGSLTVKDGSQKAHAPEPVPVRSSVTCSECGKTAVIRCGVVGEGFCADHRWMATQDQPVE